MLTSIPALRSSSYPHLLTFLLGLTFHFFHLLISLATLLILSVTAFVLVLCLGSSCG